MDFILNQYQHVAAPTVQIDTISMKQLLKLTGATGFKPTISARYGKFVHLMKGEERVLGIRLGKSIDLVNDHTTLEGMKELLDTNQHLIYYGKSEIKDGFSGNNWIAFGRKGELTAGVTYSIAQLEAAVGAA